jgi:ABC-type phosphate/phosphonate transport system substrate-binding protein
MKAGVAALPMYDWPEVRAATDRLWAALRDALRAEGVAAPEALDRAAGLVAGWTDPGLVLGQTCGLPLVRDLAGRVAVVGALDYGVPGCPPGWYRSAVVVRAGDPRLDLAGFRGARLAINGRDSQSGWGAILHHAAPLALDGGFFGAVVASGAHAESVGMVAGGAADIAAIDMVSWRLARAFRPEAAALRVLMLTDPTPGLPLIAAPGTDVARHARAVGAGIAGLDQATRAALGIRGFAPLGAGDYALVAERLEAAEARLGAMAPD